MEGWKDVTRNVTKKQVFPGRGYESGRKVTKAFSGYLLRRSQDTHWGLGGQVARWARRDMMSGGQAVRRTGGQERTMSPNSWGPRGLTLPRSTYREECSTRKSRQE